MKSSRSLVFTGNLSWPLRLIAALLIPVHVATAVPAAVAVAAASPVPPAPAAFVPQQPPGLAFAQQPASKPAKAPAVPKFSLPSRELKLSAAPSDRELMLLRCFEVPLAPLKGEPLAGENAALASALKAYLAKPSDAAPLTGFIAEHPDSRWNSSLLLNLGLRYRGQGRHSKAKESLVSSWSLTKEIPSGPLKMQADRTVGELAELFADLRDFTALDALVEETKDRDIQGAGTERFSDARTRKDFLLTLPLDKRYRCGPLAVRELFRYLRPGVPLPRGGPKIAITEQGVTLSDLSIEAKRHGLDYQIAFRAPGAPVLFPSVVHWKAGHYTWIKHKAQDGYLSREAVFGLENTVSAAVLDEEASGYCLVAAGDLPVGWRSVTAIEAGEIMGAGVTPPGGDSAPPCYAKTAKDCPKCTGMANYNIDLFNVALMLMDNPVGYQPAVGPAVEFTANYNSRETADMTNISNLGNKWSFNWLSYIKAGSTSSTASYGPGGGKATYTGFTSTGATTGKFAMQRLTQNQLTKQSDTSYTIAHLDGSQEIFDVAEPGATPRVFRSKLIDPQGNALTFAYDANYRLRTVTDALGKMTVLDYELSADPANADFYRITKVTDPFGRYATFEYTSGQLTKITDTIGIASSFTYITGDFVSSLTTPYGTTLFKASEVANTSRLIEVTDPMGARERVEWLYTAPTPFSEATVPSGSLFNSYLNNRNTFYWDKKAMAEQPGVYTAARLTHWLHSSENGLSNVVESTKAPNEARVWYSYAGQSWVGAEGPTNQPSRVARMLDDGTEQNQYFEYNAIGKTTKVTDPLGRVTTFEYAANLIDVLYVKQKNGAAYDTQAAVTYNSQHLPLTTTDASGQTTTYTYNAAGQPTTVTNAKSETTTFWYHATGNPTDATTPYNPAALRDPAAVGYLVRIVGPVAGTTTSFTYDGFGRVRTATDSQNYTVTTDYDSFDRPTKITYPDTTYEQVLYSRLDAEWLRDRLGRWTHQFHDANRHLVVSVDPMYRKTSYDWCGCGSLDSIVDPAGNRTTWQRDIQGRVTAKLYPDGRSDLFTYETTTSRLKKVTDAKGQVANYTYYLDNSLAAVTYTDTAGTPLTPATPGVTYGYDAIYPRLTSMTDGVGTTSYTYKPIPASVATPVTGAGRLATIDGPLTNDTIAYTYDALGRQLSRSINGSANTTTVHYDTLGRVDTTTNALGTFTLGYVGITGRLDHVDYPNGQRTNYTYYPNTAPVGTGNGDQRLSSIQNLKSGSVNLSTFGYTYDVVGQIDTWSRKADTGAVLTSSFKYDSVGQLRTAAVPTSATVVKNYTYGYDLAGNRTQEQIDSGVTTSVHNNVNQLTNRAPGGLMEFSGTVNEPATIALGGKPASVDGSNAWRGTATVTTGANAIPLVATDVNGNATTKTINLVVSGGTARTLSFDLAGNETSNGAGQTYTYDALNRIKTITQGTNVTEFVYNGLGQRVREKLNGTLIKQWVWDGGAQPAEERDASGSVTKRFCDGYGEQVAGTNFYYTHDHLGSVREMTDSTGAIRARYEYDPYGRATKVSGDLEADFGFTGFYRHQASGLNLTLFRAYDPELGRWLSRDPIAENGGLNLYAYVGNNPVNWIDPLGLSALGDPMSPNNPVIGEILREGGAGVALPSAGTGATIISTGVGGAALILDATKDKAKEDAPAVPIAKEKCPKKDPCKELEKRLNEHIDKLGKYKANPDAYDNLNLLKSNPDKRDQIIGGRVHHLENEIKNFQRLIANCRKNNPL